MEHWGWCWSILGGAGGFGEVLEDAGRCWSTEVRTGHPCAGRALAVRGVCQDMGWDAGVYGWRLWGCTGATRGFMDAAPGPCGCC